MSSESNIILITNEKNIAEILKPKLVLLRGIDNISTSNYEQAVNMIKKHIPDTILIYCSDEKQKCLELIKVIKSSDTIKNTTIMLVIDEYDQDFALSAYDEGISDYFSINANDAEILMRTIWCLKKNTLINTVQKQTNLLEDLNVINSNTGFYLTKYTETVFNSELKVLKKQEIDITLMLIEQNESKNNAENTFELAHAIKISCRDSDIIAHSVHNRFIILLPKTNINGALCVWDKIKQSIEDESLVKATVCEVTDESFKELKDKLIDTLSKSQELNQDIIVIREQDETNSDDWLDKLNSNQKNFKLFKQAFSKKLEKVIAPVFFQMQKVYEEKLFKTKIEQYSNSTLSLFSLKRLKKESELKITYPGFSKINIDIIHKGLETPENRRINLDLTELTEEKLSQIVEEFINEF